MLEASVFGTNKVHVEVRDIHRLAQQMSQRK